MHPHLLLVSLMHNPILLIALPVLIACAVLFAGRLLRKRWWWLRALLASLLVMAAHIAILAYQDYSWASSVRQQLPADALIIREVRAPVAQHFWTQLNPPVSLISVVSNINTTMISDGEVLLEFDRLDLMLGQTAQPAAKTTMLNCTSQDLVSQLDGSILIESLPAGDSLLRLLCPSD